MHIDKQWYKNQNTKNLPYTALTMLYLHSNKPNAATFVHYRILKKLNEIMFSSASLLACLPTETNIKPIPLCI